MQATYKILKRVFTFAGVCGALAVALSACGGGGGGGGGDTLASETSVGPSISLSGTVVDGPIQGATVFLDLNGNQARDAEEPVSGTTNAQGAFTLVTELLSSEQLASAMLVTHIPETAKDADDGGDTLQQAGRKGFTLITPASAYVQIGGDGAHTATSIFLSPLTTLVAGQMLYSGLTLADAKAAVQHQLDLQGKDPMTNFVAEPDAGLASLARKLANLFGDARESVDENQIEGSELETGERVEAVLQLAKIELPALISSASFGTLSALGTTTESGDIVETSTYGNTGKAQASTDAGQQAFQDFVVVFHSDVGNASAKASDLISGRGGQLKFTYENAIKGFAVRLPAAAADAFLAAMERNPNVDYVEIDKPVALSATTTQNLAPWGLDRIDQAHLPLNSIYSYPLSTKEVHAYVLDTGIRSSHLEFGGRVKSGYTSISDGNGTNDCNGHGTHVAGIIGAATYGVAKSVSLVPVRVLDCAGEGTTSTVIAGIDWVVANAARPALLNMALGGGASYAVDSAVATVVSKGIPVVVSAGNSGADACNESPAREPLAITVGASTEYDERAGYSNFGTCVDLFAPGSSIMSAWHTSNTASETISGTSMASPHVAGIVARILQFSPDITPAQVADAVKAAASKDKVTNDGLGSSNLLLHAAADAFTTKIEPQVTLYASITSIGKSTEWGQYGYQQRYKGWRAKTVIVVKDKDSVVVPGAVVSGRFSVGGPFVKCTTGSNGACNVASHYIHENTSQTKFSIRSVQGTNLAYSTGLNTVSKVTVQRP